MKKICSAAILLAAFASAHAENFTFAYTFGDSQAITGSLSGHLNGDLVENVSNVHINFNGTDFTGALTGASWDASTHNWNSAAGAVVSTVAGKNNFIFADANPQTNYNDVSNYFFFVTSSDAQIGNQAYALNCNGNCTDAAFDQPTNNISWSLVAAPVPEPSSAAMLIAGLGVAGVIARRRRQA
ncbi:PEP-CTERM sorting domain-containing protein [Rugamonas aquatica]|uniref:PEP-CTERM sorting domain-containing protein n=1 Tax=Rugamonas aquatica TaxID=2743357 RepID=A0A6A7N7V0_9BURK|nr:PEP-CTERM sorting domain-containing protein [Rugamonas aquatica]MQA41165.1 PEP-CTERM sorting domain-containing protein [Rugamonas aquatica]